MFGWFKNKLETRSSSYTDALVTAIVDRAGGQTLAVATATGALEACSGLVGRSFAISEVNAPANIQHVLTPDLLAMLGRSLIRKGEIAFLIRTENGLELLPCETIDVYGTPGQWSYNVSLAGPSRTLSYEKIESDSVLHFRYATDPEQPWLGIGPIQSASLAGKLSAETLALLGDEVSGPRGSLLPVPVDGDDPTVTKLRADIKILKGQIALVQAGDWDNSGGGRNTQWETKRVGANPPMALIELLKQASQEIYAACGINATLFSDQGASAGLREAYRVALFSVVSPLSKIVSHELSIKLDSDVSLDFTELRAGDISGRARAFQSLVGGGMEIDKAAALSGLIMPE